MRSPADYVNRPGPPKTLRLLRLDQVEERAVEWLWPGVFPVRKLSILGGVQGLGKSQLSIDMAARISRGWGWPNERDAEQPIGSTIFCAMEDDVADTIKPRARAAGADETKIHVVDAAADREDEERPFELDRDLPALAQWIEHLGDVRLLVIDPVMNYMNGRTNTNADAEVRRALLPVVRLAQQYGIAVLGVMHIKKGLESEALFKIGGSVAFTALARAAWCVGVDPNDSGMRVFAHLKSNLAKPAPSMRFEIRDGAGGSCFLAWDTAPCGVTANDLFAPQEHGGGENRQEAREIILQMLKAGPCPAKVMEAERDAAGIPEKTFKRAKQDLKVISYRDDKEWKWRLP